MIVNAFIILLVMAGCIALICSKEKPMTKLIGCCVMIIVANMVLK